MTYGSRRVFIGGISGTVTREQIEAEFSKYGKLNKVWVAQNPPGFAFVEYTDDRDADEAIKSLNGTRLFSSNEIRVERSRSRQDHQSGGGPGPDRRGRPLNRMMNNNGPNNFGGAPCGYDNNGGGGNSFRYMNQGGNGAGPYQRGDRYNGGGGSGGPFRPNRMMGSSGRYNNPDGGSFSRYESDGGIGRFNPLASDRPQRGRFVNSNGGSNSDGGGNNNGMGYQRGRFQGSRDRNHSNNNGAHFSNQYGGNNANNFRSRSPIDFR